MKRIVSIALALLMLVAFAACSKKTENAKKDKAITDGYWNATIDAKALMEQELAGKEGTEAFLANLKDCTLDLEIKFHDDGEATIKCRTTEFVESFKNAYKAMMDSYGITLTDEELNEFADEFAKEIKEGMDDISQPYTVDGDKITIGDVNGTISNGKMKLNFEAFGEVTFKQN